MMERRKEGGRIGERRKRGRNNGKRERGMRKKAGRYEGREECSQIDHSIPDQHVSHLL